MSLPSSFEQLLLNIATPYSTGTGFYWPGPDVVVTNEQVVRDNREAVVEGPLFPRSMTRVLFTDAKYDLAFLEIPPAAGLPALELNTVTPAPGADVWALGFIGSKKTTYAQGVVTALTPDDADEAVQYLHHDAALSPANSGSPLLDAQNKLIGVNTFHSFDGVHTALALPVKYLWESWQAFQAGGGAIGSRCLSCETVVFTHTIDQKKYCPNCGAVVELPNQHTAYEPEGVAYTLEAMLAETGHDPKLARVGPNNWEIKQGSACVNISYYEKTGLITGDAYLCELPKEQHKSLYEFLLRQNYEVENLTFSIKGQDIVLSLLIFDRYLNIDTGLKLLQHLFDTADKYDNILVEQFGAQWKEADE